MEVKNLSFQYDKNNDKKFVLNDVSVNIPKGKITALIGPNGCGKTTLLHLMTKNLKPTSGEILLDNVDLRNISLKKFSRKVTIVHQYNTSPPDLSVKALVTYGRIPYRCFYKGLSDEDEQVVDWAMKTTEIDKLKDERIDSLSGGQKQRVFIAMALAQKTEVLFLDEPTTYLDIRYQIQILELIKKLNEEYKMTVVMVLHDINHAICYSDEIIGMKDGKVVFQGNKNKVINRESLHDIFNVYLKVLHEENQDYVLALDEGF